VAHQMYPGRQLRAMAVPGRQPHLQAGCGHRLLEVPLLPGHPGRCRRRPRRGMSPAKSLYVTLDHGRTVAHPHSTSGSPDSRKQPLTWSPVTESNRRPSPYHKYALLHFSA
jgi:hypothetical protein